MWFRMEKYEQEEEDIALDDVDQSGSGEVDEYLKRYFMEYEQMSPANAENAARQRSGGKPAICIDIANDSRKISDYNEKMLYEYGFVTELTYEGQRLTKRLCPHCHNEVVRGAGLYEMKLIAMYGDTNAGKTVFLSVLEAMLKGDPRLGEYTGAFHGMMSFQGTDQEREQHLLEYERLIKDKVLYDATTAGARVAPRAFRFSYRTAENAGRDRDLLLVFCDIAGEDTRSLGGLQRSGFYLRNVDGIITLLDATRLTNVSPYLHGTIDGENVGDVALRAEEALTNLSTYLDGIKISIPTAVVVTKLDVLKSISMVAEDPEFSKIIYASGANNIHQKFLDKKTITDMNRAVQKMLQKLGGELFCNTVEHCFSRFNYFAVSALGRAPEKKVIVNDFGEETVIKQVSGSLEPFRVTEPFYWILAQCNCIPYRYQEVWQDKKGKEKDIEVKFYYYESERAGIAQQQLQKIRESKIKKPKRWELVDRLNRL